MEGHEQSSEEREAIVGDQGSQIGGGGFDPNRPHRTSSPPPGASPKQPDPAGPDPDPDPSEPDPDPDASDGGTGQE